MATDDRLQRLLGGEALSPLRSRLRQRYERAGASNVIPSFRISKLTTAERTALASLQGSSVNAALSIQINVATIDEILRRASVADSLRDALVQLDGPIVDRAAERDEMQRQWRDVIDGCRYSSLLTLLQTPNGFSLLKRIARQDHAVAAQMIASTETVLHRLPAPGIARAQLAAEALGDAHALDAGCSVATLVLEVLRASLIHKVSLESESTDSTDRAERSQRDLWASAGVLVNELARPVLVLNLPGFATLGEPTYLSLRYLLRSPPTWAVRGVAVFVCENPNMLAIAADQLAERCAPMVCTDGMPAAAQRSLLKQLAAAGAALRYHGDFDWPGLHIGNYLIREFAATPWRFGVIDYRAALRVAPTLGRTLNGNIVEASWDAALATGMRQSLRAVDEEMVKDALLHDLAQ